MANQGFTAADMADQGAAQFRRGYEAAKAELRAAAQEAVAYLDIGAGGYLDIGSDLPEEQLLALPNGRHALGIIGTYGIDGYVSAPVTATPGIDRCSLLDIVAWWNSYTGPVDEALGEVIRRIRTLIDSSPKGDHFVDATKMVQDSPKGGSEARDAARYRYHRDRGITFVERNDYCAYRVTKTGDAADTATDAAMQAQAVDVEVQP